MDKELTDIKNALDSITNNMYGLSRVGEIADAIKDIKESIENIGQIGLKPGEWSGNSGATLGDIKAAIEGISIDGSSGGSSPSTFNPQLDKIESAIERNTSEVAQLVEAVRTIAEIHLQQLSLQENTAAAHAALPWSKTNPKPNLDYGWVEDLEQATGEKDLEDATL